MDGDAAGLPGRPSGTSEGRRPHVLIIVQNLPLRLDRRVRTQCRALTDAGYDVSVICPREESGEPRRHLLDRTIVYSYPPTPPTRGVLGYVREYAECWTRTALLSVRVHRDRPFDVIQTCNPPDTYWLLGRIWKAVGRRFVFDQHDLCPEVYEVRFGRRGPLHRALLALERQNYRTADRLISPNPMYRELALARGAVDPGHAVVVMSTPDAQLMRRGPACPELRGGYAHLVCYVGVMGPQDGVDHLLDAIDYFVRGLGRSDTRFALLGFGDCLEELRADSAARGLDPWVHFTGKVDHEELGTWLSTADVGVTPDPFNDFNDRSTMNKTLEYMAHEVPVVASDLRETRRCAEDAAVYVSGDDPEETAAALAALLDDPVRGDQGAVRGRPRHPMRAGDLVDRTVARGDRRRESLPEPHRQPRPGRDRLRLLRERPSWAGRFETSQAPLAPPQLDRLAAGVQVLDPHHRPVLDSAGDHPARRAGCFALAMLDDDAKVILAEPFDADDDELVFQSEQH